MAPLWKKLMKNVDLEEATSFLDHIYLGCTQCECKPNELIIEEDTKMFESRISAGATETVTRVRKASRKNGRMVLRYGRTCSKMRVERYCELANEKTEQLYQVSIPCLDEHNFKKDELETVGELSQVCSPIVLICLYPARIGRPNNLWSVNESSHEWTQPCDRRLARLISYIHHASDC